MIVQPDLAFRTELARKIQELRANKHIWRPGAPRADLCCRRGQHDVEIARFMSSVPLESLVALAAEYSIPDLSKLTVTGMSEADPYENWDNMYLLVTLPQRVADTRYAKDIEVLWEEYQRSLLRNDYERQQYAQFLVLKQQFEPF
jgi:hypothetical protein